MKSPIQVNSISDFHRLLCIEAPGHPLVSVVYLNRSDVMRKFGESSYVSGLYFVVLKDGCSTAMGYGRKSYDFDNGTMIFLSPGQVVIPGNSGSAPDAMGWMLVFHPDLIRKSELGKDIDQYNFFSYHIKEALHLSENEINSLTELVKKIEMEYKQNIDAHSQNLIISNIKLVLDYCLRYYDRQFYTRSNMNRDILTKFEQLLKDYYKSNKQRELGVPTVKYCGESLCLSPKYLSDLLRKETGTNARDHIINFVIDHAKTRLLNYTGSINEISYDLGFEYPQHFSKLFKNRTGMTPGAFRSNLE